LKTLKPSSSRSVVPTACMQVHVVLSNSLIFLRHFEISSETSRSPASRRHSRSAFMAAIFMASPDNPTPHQPGNCRIESLPGVGAEKGEGLLPNPKPGRIAPGSGSGPAPWSTNKAEAAGLGFLGSVRTFNVQCVVLSTLVDRFSRHMDVRCGGRLEIRTTGSILGFGLSWSEFL